MASLSMQSSIRWEARLKQDISSLSLSPRSSQLKCKVPSTESATGRTATSSGILTSQLIALCSRQEVPFIEEAKQDFFTVGDFMTPIEELFVVKQSTTVDEALELLVENRITGLPVVDDAGKLIGVVSDYDLLALDSISGKRRSDTSLFPEAGRTWKAFKEIQILLSKTQGRTVGEVMTPSPLVIRKTTNLEDAARLLLQSKYRRLPVTDDSGKLVGLLTRGNVIRAALKVQRAEKHRGN